MSRIIIGVIIVTLSLVALMPAYSATSPSFLSVLIGVEYAVERGTDRWCQGLNMRVTDQDGLDNLFVDGNISIKILAPDGCVYPLPTDELVVRINPDVDPPNVAIQWYNPMLHPPVLGSYEITITDKNGLSSTYLTQPTTRVSERVPTILYPPESGMIDEDNPTIVWDAFSSQATYHIELCSGGEVMWVASNSTQNPPSVIYDGPKLLRGETYALHLFAFEDETINDVEVHRVTSRRCISFSLAPIMSTVVVNPQVLNLGSQGKWITAYVELAEGVDIRDIAVSSLLLNQTVCVDASAPFAYGDYDADGVQDLMVKFSRAEVERYIIDTRNPTETLTSATLTLTGKLNDGTPFQGSDAIRVVMPNLARARARFRIAGDVANFFVFD